MRREEGTGAMPLWGAGSELEFRLRFVRNVREDRVCAACTGLSAPHLHGGPGGAAVRAGGGGAPLALETKGDQGPPR